MKKHLKVVELFAGIGAPRKALMRGGYNFTVVDAIEIDKYPVASYNAIYGENIIPQSVTDYFPSKEDLGEVDLVWNSSPCQDISTAGKGAGAKEGSGTRSSLVYEAIRIVSILNPKFVIWENVKGLVSKKHRPVLDDYIDRLNELGYRSQFQILNAKDYGIPQNRERIFVVSVRNDVHVDFTFPLKQELKLKLKDILEDDVDEKYYLSDEQVNKIKNSKFTQEKARLQEKSFVQNKYEKFIEKQGYIPEMFNPYNEKEIKDVAPTQSTYCGSMTSSATVLIKNNTKQGIDITWDKIGDTIDVARTLTTACRTLSKSQMTTGVLENNLRIRKLTPKECWRLMGFDDDDFEKAEKVNSNTQLYKQAGNSVVVNVIEAIFDNLLVDYQ